MEASKARQNLLDLPAEVRNRIYEYVLAPGGREMRTVELRPRSTWRGVSQVMGRASFASEPSQNQPLFSTASQKTPALCRVSTPVRLETLPMYYANTSFILHLVIDIPFHEQPKVCSSIEHWLAAIGKTSVQLVRSVQVIIARNSNASQSYNHEEIMQGLGSRLQGLHDRYVDIRIAKGPLD